MVVLEFDGQPDTDRTQALWNQPGYKNVFGADSAVIHGKEARYQGRNLLERRYDRIVGWKDPGTWLSFRLRAVEPGRFHVLITYNAGADSAGNEFAVAIGPNTLNARVDRGLDPFETFMLGTVQLQPGDYEMAIRAASVRKGTGLPDVHAVTLIPAP